MVAERARFELAVPFPALQFSRLVHSTALAPLHGPLSGYTILERTLTVNAFQVTMGILQTIVNYGIDIGSLGTIKERPTAINEQIV